MNEQTSERKVVSRTVAIAFGIICMILLASLGGALAMIYNQNNTSANLQQQVTTLNQKMENAPAELSLALPSPVWSYNSSIQEPIVTFNGAFIVNFGAESASGVQIIFTFTPAGSAQFQETWSVGTVLGHSVHELPTKTYLDIAQCPWTCNLTWT